MPSAVAKSDKLGRDSEDGSRRLDLRVRRRPLLTVGHGARSTDELVAVLRSAAVGRLVDVRRYPGSRRHPQFSRQAMASDLAARGVSYEWRGEELGGRRKPAEPTRQPAQRKDTGLAISGKQVGRLRLA